MCCVHADGSLQSSPLLTPDQYGVYVYPGGSVNATFVQDPDTFGRTLYCNKVSHIHRLTPVLVHEFLLAVVSLTFLWHFYRMVSMSAYVISGHVPDLVPARMPFLCWFCSVPPHPLPVSWPVQQL